MHDFCVSLVVDVLCVDIVWEVKFAPLDVFVRLRVIGDVGTGIEIPNDKGTLGVIVHYRKGKLAKL